jgi:hypothetical protein
VKASGFAPRTIADGILLAFEPNAGSIAMYGERLGQH